MGSTDDQNSSKTNTTVTPYYLFSIVTENKGFYTWADIEGAYIARRDKLLLGWPSTSNFKTYVNNNLLLNCNITVDEISIAEHIYGEATPILQGETRRKTSTVHLKIEKYIDLFQYQRDKKTYIYTFFFSRRWFDSHTQ